MSMYDIQRQSWNKELTSKRVCVGGYGNLDILKLALAILVMIRHIGQNFFRDNIFWRVYIINTISTIGVTSFFIISGFLLYKKTVTKERLRKQVFRILKLYGCWTIVYFPLIIYEYLKHRVDISHIVVDFAQKAIFDGTYYHLWYLPSLIVAMCIVYVMKNRRLVLMLVTSGLMIIGILTNAYGLRFPQMYYTIFLTTRNGLFMGSFLVAIGKCFADYGDNLRKFKHFKLVLLVAIISLYSEGVLVSKYDSQIIIDMTFSTVMVAVILVGFMISRVQMKVSKTVRNASTLIYFMHPWIIFLVALLEHFGIVLNASIKASITVFVSIYLTFTVLKMSNKFKIINKFV